MSTRATLVLKLMVGGRSNTNLAAAAVENQIGLVSFENAASCEELAGIVNPNNKQQKAVVTMLHFVKCRNPTSSSRNS